MEFYEGHPARERALNAPFSPADIDFSWKVHDPNHELDLPEELGKGGCSCDSGDPCFDFDDFPPWPWSRQNKLIEISEEDAVSFDGQEIYNLIRERNIRNILILGVHTNCCVLGRPFGIRQMIYMGFNTALCRDLTDSFHRTPGRHFEGLDYIIRHIESCWCPTIESSQITGKAAFTFRTV
jgi:nicotinamidase-related amidase